MFRGPGQQRPNSDGFIYIHYAASPDLARISANLPPSVWQSLVDFLFLTYVCNTWQLMKLYAEFTEGW